MNRQQGQMKTGKGHLGLVQGGEGKERVPKSRQNLCLVYPPSWPSCRRTAEMPSRALSRAQPDHCPTFISVQLSQLTNSSEQGSCGVPVTMSPDSASLTSHGTKLKAYSAQTVCYKPHLLYRAHKVHTTFCMYRIPHTHSMMYTTCCT